MSDLEMMQRRQKVLADFGDLALQSEDLDEVLTEACRLVGEALGTGRAKVLEIEEGGQSLFVRAGVGWAADVVGKVHIPMGENSSESFSIKAGEPVITQDIREDDRFDVPPFMKEAGVVALANVPIFLPGKAAYGLLQVDDTKPRDFDRNDTEFLRTYATILGPVIDRLFKLHALRASEERFRLTVEAATDYAIFVTDAEDRIVDWLPGAAAVFGWSAEEAKGQPGAIVFTPEDREAGVPEQEIEAARAEGSAPNNREHLRRDGSRVFIEGTVRALHDGQGQLAGFLKIGQDVTGRHAAEARRRESEAWQAFLLKLSDALRPLGDPVAIQAEASRLLGEHLGSDRAYYVQVDEARGEFVVARDWHRPGATSHARRYPLEAWPMPSLTDGKTWVVRDVATDPAMPDDQREFYKGNEIGSLIVVPLVKGGRLVATFLTNQATPRDWTAQEVRLVEEVAERTWAALECARAEDALRESETNFRVMADAAPPIIWVTDAEGRLEFFNRQWEAYIGAPASLATAAEVATDFVHPDDAALTMARFKEAARTGSAFEVEHRIRSKTGEYRWFLVRAEPYRDLRSGAIVRWFGASTDIHDRKMAEDELRESEERFRQFGEASGDVLWIRNAETLEFEYVSPAVEEVHGTRPQDLLAGNQMLRWAGMILPEDRDKALDAIRRVRAGEHVLHAFRILRRGDGAVRWIRDHSFPLLDAEGKVQRIGGIGHDATEEIELQDRLRVLVAELQHRTRNLMGVVRSVTDKTLSGSTSLEDFGSRIRDRLNALARVNGLLSRLDGGRRITFEELLRTELMAHGVVDPDESASQVTLEGSEGIRLRSSTVQTLALGLHELATNALKHGALSRPEGRLSVSWKLLDGPEGEPRLQVDWRESGVPVLTVVPDRAAGGEPTAPRRRGYGRELIEKALPYQLKAETSYELTSQGLRCRISLPVSSTMGRAEPTTGEEPNA